MISDSSPLTKADGKHILELMNQILLRLNALKVELRDELKLEMQVEIQASEERIKDDFRRGIQIVREDVATAHLDRFAQHQDRLDDHDGRIVVLEGASAAL